MLIDLMKLEEQVAGLMFMQENLEAHLNGANWKKLGHNYGLCIVMEAAEAIEHYGWKHWKHIEPNIPAAKMELVDILHFWLASELVHGTTHTALAATMSYGMVHISSDVSFVEAMTGIIASVSYTDTMPVVNFFTAMTRIDMSWDELHMLYLTKHTLNIFRRDNGYADGSYVKDWDGVEDNVHAEALARAMGDDLLVSVLYDELKSAYKIYTN